MYFITSLLQNRNLGPDHIQRRLDPERDFIRQSQRMGRQMENQSIWTTNGNILHIMLLDTLAS